MVATRRTVGASTSAQRARRIVARATPPCPKQSRSASTASATRDAAGLQPRTRARRALLTTAAEPATLRRSSSPALSSPDRGVSLDTPLASRQLFPLCRVAADPSPVPADLTQWRRGIFDRLPRLDTVPRNYADLRAFLQAVELAVQALDRPADAFHITMQQLHPRLQAHIRSSMTAQPDPTRTPYEHMVAILIQQVAPGKPEDYLHQTIALIARRTETQISRLRMQFTEAYDAYHDLCARLRSPPHLGEHFVVTAFLGNLPKDIARDTRNRASAADRLNDLQYVARLAINSGTLARTYPGKGEANTVPRTPILSPSTTTSTRLPPRTTRQPPHLRRRRQSGSYDSPTAPSLGPCFFCNASDHGHRACPSYLRACQHDLTLASKCPACRAPGYCLVSCPRRQHFIRSTRFPYLEVDRFGHSYYIRADLPSPAWFHPGLLRAVLAHERPAPQAPQQPSVALLQLHPGAADAAPPPPTNTDPRPMTPPPADPPAAQRAVFCAAPPAPSAPSAPPALCNHTRLGAPPRASKSPTRTRAWATIDAVRCEVIIDRGADLSLISAGALRPHRSYQPWAPAHGSVTGVNNHTLQALGRVALEVRLGPLKTTAPFFVVPGVAFAALLGVDFLYEHEIAISMARHALIFEGHGGRIFPLLGHHPRLTPLCALARDVALNPGSTAWVCTTLLAPATVHASPLVYLVAASTIPGVGLAIPEQLTSGLIVIRNTSNRPLHLSAGWPLAKAVRLPPAAIDSARLVATDSAPPPTDGTADTPSYERVPGGFIPTLPSPNSCLLPAELQQLRNLLHEFQDRSNDGSEPLPATSLLKARLDTGDAQPISTPPRRLSPAMREAVRDAVADLDAQGITEPSTGCWSTPIVMVRKASGAWRLCCDYRAINMHVCIPQQPLPRTDDILASFNGKKSFSALDMCKGFYQIEIAEEDRPKTSFVTPDCQRQYRRLSFGFLSRPAIFQRMVDPLLGGMKWVSAVGYIDDIIVYSDTWDAHRAHLRQLFQALRDASLQPTPWEVLLRCCGGQLPEPHCVARRYQAVPLQSSGHFGDAGSQTAKAVQRFLGKCQYYRKFIPNSSITAAPLFQAAARQEDFTWRPAADTAWRTLCKVLSSEPVLAHPDYTRPFYLDCDGSGEGLGAVLLQPYDESERVVAYASRPLLDHERKWTAELEAAALIWALETFRHYIDTMEVCIRTDHAPLKYIRHNSSQCRRLERWELRLQEFRFKVIQRPGAKQKHADCLSRAPLLPTPTQRPIILDEVSSRTVLRARAEHPAPAAPTLLWCAPLCAAVNHVAHSAHRRMRLLRHRLRHMCAAVRTADPPAQLSASGSDDDADVQVCLTDSDDDSPPPPTAQPPDNAPPKVIQGGRSIPLPPAVKHLSLKDAQAQDPECREFPRLARTPRAAWPPHLRHTPLQFCVLHDLVYVRIGDALPRVVLPAISAVAPFKRITSAITAVISVFLRPRRALPAGIGGHTSSGTFAPTSAAALSASQIPTPHGNGSGSPYL
ncbi:hypothetical protein Emag_007715 [Eimeria magna]